MTSEFVEVELDDIAEAMHMSVEGIGAPLLDLETGVVLFGEPDPLAEDDVDEPGPDPDRYVEIPRVPAADDYRLMCQYAAGVEDESLRDLLEVALQGRGAFKRFREVLRRDPDAEAAWFAKLEKAHISRAQQWLDALGIPGLVGVMRPPPAPAVTVPDAPGRRKPGPPPVGLLDLLLFGAPDGKTEVLDGRTRRVLHARTDADARGVFKTIARELCALSGREWRRRYVEGTSVFEIERARLSVDGPVVTLEIVVDTAVWRMFEP